MLRGSAQDRAYRRVVAMSLFGGSRFTARLATIAILGTAGSLSWIIVSHVHLKSGASGRSVDRAPLSRSAGRGSRLKNERSNKFASFRRSERPQPTASGWSDDRGQWRERSVAPQVFADYTNISLQDRGADMPLPVPPITRAGLETSQAKFPLPQVSAPPPPVESQKRLMRDPRPEPAAVATPNSPKLAARSYYIEKLVEQGDAGEVKFRYRRQSCEPPNMPDVCFMPQESRRNIVVERR
jgi:hypothetical protein